MTDWITEWLQQNKAEIDRLADTIFTHPETAGEETQSAAALENFLQKNGFSVSKNTAGLPTAFTAEKGKGEPRIAFLAEYDALPNLGQNPVAHCDPVPGNGHGCGHNLLGAGIAAAACALAYALEQENLLGQVVVYGCPEEEICRGKIVMANAHCFDRDDAAISWHPADKNQVSEEVFQAMTSRVFRFYGKSAHAAASPEMGRSALDAAELTNVAVNYLREHVPTDVRMHYVYTHAGDKPNIVPNYAELWYYIRAASRKTMLDADRRVILAAEGAAHATETRMETEELTRSPETLLNRTLMEAGQGLCRSHPKGIGAAGSCPGGNAPPAGRQPPVCTRFHGCICRKLAHPDGDTEYRLSGTGHPRASLVGDGVLRGGAGAHRYEQGGTDHGLLWAGTLPAVGAAAQSPR